MVLGFLSAKYAVTVRTHLQPEPDTQTTRWFAIFAVCVSDMVAREHKENFRDAIWEAVKALEAVSECDPVPDVLIHHWMTIMEQKITGETFWGVSWGRRNGQAGNGKTTQMVESPT